MRKSRRRRRQRSNRLLSPWARDVLIILAFVSPVIVYAESIRWNVAAHDRRLDSLENSDSRQLWEQLDRLDRRITEIIEDFRAAPSRCRAP